MAASSSAADPKRYFPEMLKIVCSILSRNESLVFREPVDHVGLGLDDYPLIVTKPMDLGTVKKKIENDEYDTVDDIAADIRLVWSNCMLYNRDGSEVRLCSAADAAACALSHSQTLTPCVSPLMVPYSSITSPAPSPAASKSRTRHCSGAPLARLDATGFAPCPLTPRHPPYGYHAFGPPETRGFH